MSKAEESMTKARLQVMLDGLLSGEGKLRYRSRIPLILNEHAPVSKIFFLGVPSDCENTSHATHLECFYWDSCGTPWLSYIILVVYMALRFGLWEVANNIIICLHLVC